MKSIELLIGLLKNYSPTGSEQNAVKYLTEWMSNSGMNAHIDSEGNAIGTIGTGKQSIFLLGHIDTVPGNLSVQHEQDLIYGRGAVDAKGPLAAFAAAASLGEVPGKTVTVIGAVGEEGDSRGAEYILKNMDPPQYVIIGEPSRWNRITIGYKGSITIKISATIPTSHPASRTPNACNAILSTWKNIENFTDHHNSQYDKVFDQIMPTVRSMQSDDNEIEELAQMVITFRIPDNTNYKKLQAKLQNIIEPPVALSVFPGAVNAYRSSKNNNLVRTALNAIRIENGKPSFVLKTGTSDMNIVAPKWKCPIIAYGPGDSNLDHTPNEHISCNEFIQSIQIIRTILENIPT
ncbi:MAG TPA: acetyl-lysine deacetylase [Chloroflexi bacterium]|nr:acetyl-lysine deacetylase [Chloroflexota bacterium]